MASDLTGYKVKRILLVKETTAGEIPATPVLINTFAESFDLAESQASEDISLLGAIDASPMAFGISTFSGSVGFVISVENISIMLTHILGTALTNTDATTEAWDGGTVYTKGNIVNHSDTKHSLVCWIGGTSAGNVGELAEEPTVDANAKLDQDTQVVDNAVTWIRMPKLLSATFEIKQQMQSFTIEVEHENATGELFYQRFSNVYMNNMPLAMTGSTISAKVAMDFTGAKGMTSESADWTTPLSGIAGAKICNQLKDFYDYEDFSLQIDSQIKCGIESMNIAISRNLSIDPLLNKCLSVNIGLPTLKGSVNREFSTNEYNKTAAHTDFEAIFDFKKANGCSYAHKFPFVQPVLGKVATAVDKQTYLGNDITAHDKADVRSSSATVVYPALIQDDGTYIGAY